MSRQLQVTMIIQSYLPRLGGAERQLAGLAPLLKDRGVQLQVLTRRYPGMVARETIDGVPVIRTPVWGGKVGRSLLYSLFGLVHLRRLKPDVIHVHELLSPATTAVLAHRLWGIPVVAKVLRGGRLGDLAKLHDRLGGRQRLAAQRRHFAAFIAISREIDAELAAAGIPAGQRTFIPNGVDTTRFAPPAEGRREEVRSRLGLQGPVAVYTGRLVPEKQVDLLLSTWPAVRSTHPHATLLILGSGEELQRLQAMAGPGIQFPGRVDDVIPYLQAADLFVLPSATEGLSNALLEAMAVGVPPVATAVGGAPDLITSGENGLLVPAGDTEALQGAILSLLANPARLPSMGARARERVVSDYSLQSVADRLRGLYGRLTSGSPANMESFQGAKK